MTQPDSNPRSASRLTVWVVSVAIGLLVLSCVAAPFMVWHRVAITFLARATEVDPLIEALYLHYFETGVWPESLHALGRVGMNEAPGEWQYVWPGDDDDKPPILRLSGPLHMKLEYVFRKGGDTRSPGGWTATCEGDPVDGTFHERIPARPVPKGR